MKKVAWLLASVMLVSVFAAACTKDPATPKPDDDDDDPTFETPTPVYHDPQVGDCIHEGTKGYWELNGVKYLDEACLEEATAETLVLPAVGHALGDDDICETCGWSVWDGTVATSFSDTSEGTADDPIEIAHASELALLAQNVNKEEGAETYEGKFIKLTVDIDLGATEEIEDAEAGDGSTAEVAKNWAPIGGFDLPEEAIKSYANILNKHPFSGTFDGDNHTIHRLTSHTNYDLGKDRKRVGLFGLTNGATIKNIQLAEVDVMAEMSDTSAVGENQRAAGALICNAEGTLVVDNVKLLSGKVEGWACVGGAIGLIGAKSSSAITEQVKVLNVENHLEVFSRSNKAGGIVGASGAAWKLRTLIEGCVNYGNVHGNGKHVGGIVGAMLSATKENTCEGKWQIIRNCKNFGDIAGNNTAGGIAGVCNGRVVNCWTWEDIKFMHKSLWEEQLILGDVGDIMLDISVNGFNSSEFTYYGVICGMIEAADKNNSAGMVDWQTCGVCDKDGNPAEIWTSFQETMNYLQNATEITEADIATVE